MFNVHLRILFTLVSFRFILFISWLFVCRFALSALKNAVSKNTAKQNYRSPILVRRCLNSFKLIVKTRIDGNLVSCSLFIAYDINKIAALSFILFMNRMQTAIGQQRRQKTLKNVSEHFLFSWAVMSMMD